MKPDLRNTILNAYLLMQEKDMSLVFLPFSRYIVVKKNVQGASPIEIKNIETNKEAIKALLSWYVDNSY